MDFKRLLQLVQTYADDVQSLLEAGQAAALHQQQEYVQQLTADAAAVVGGSIEAALTAAHKAHQQQVCTASRVVGCSCFNRNGLDNCCCAMHGALCSPGSCKAHTSS
jgi:hypothetical protein